MDKQQVKQDKFEGSSKRYLRELREKWLKSRKEEEQTNYFKAVKEYNYSLIMEGEI